MQKQIMVMDIRQAVLKSKMEIYEAAIEYFAGNIDNHIGQIAAAVKFKIATMQITGSQYSISDIEETQAMMSDLIKGLQHISCNSYIVCLSEMNIVSAVEMEIQRFSIEADMPISFSLKGNVYRFSIEKTILLFRTWQQVMYLLLETKNCHELSVGITYGQDLILIRVCADCNIDKSIFCTGEVYDRAQLVGIKYKIEDKNRTANLNSIILELMTY